jgi:hypothetical protein
MGATLLRSIPWMLGVLASAVAVLWGLMQLSTGRDAKGLYWVVIGLLILRGVGARLNTDSRE